MFCLWLLCCLYLRPPDVSHQFLRIIIYTFCKNRVEYPYNLAGYRYHRSLTKLLPVVPVVGSRVVPVFFRSRPFFFPPPHTCLVSFLAGRPEATPRSVCSPLSPGRGGRWSLGDCAVVSTREFAHTRNTDTTLSGGSLGSCVDEERS